MRRRSQSNQRRGATLVEAAIIYPIAVLLTVGLMIFGMGVSRYNQVAGLAREGARWASVHGAQYASDHPSGISVSGTSIKDYLVTNKMAAMDSDALTVTAAWSPSNAKGGEVTVTVSYNWIPEAYWGSITFTSTSKAIVTY